MDHITLPKNSLQAHPDITLFSQHAVTFGTPEGEVWLGYDERNGWDWDSRISDFAKCSADDPRLRDLEDFLQEWLFFGLLGFTFGNLYRREDFVCQNGQLVTTAKLTSLLIELSTNLKRSHPWILTEAGRDELLSDIRLNLEDTWAWLWGLERFSAAQQASDFSWLLLSIECLCKSLEHAVVSLQARRRRRSQDCEDNTLPWIIPSRPWPINTAVASNMRERGWCPYTVQRLGDMLGGPALWYLSCGQRFGRLSNHERCSKQTCLTRKLDKQLYKPRHVDESCSCALIGPPTKDMCDILEGDAIPLLQINGETVNDVHIVLSSSKQNHKYVALSHVISDGWGNFKENKLPACQLIRIQKLVDDLFCESTREHTPLWIDSITVPLADDSPEHHLIAMESMVESYSNAAKVLVLDDELLHTPSTLPLQDLQLRVAASDWMSRLWTLQEGVLTCQKGLYLQLSDRALLYDDTFTARLTKSDPFQDLDIKTLCWTSLLQMENIVGLADFTIPMSQRFDVLLSLFRGRSTNIPGDVPYVFCNLTKIDPAPILRLPYEHDVRQRYLATTQTQWPQSILFHHGPRLHEYGYRWFMQSFIQTDGAKGGIGGLRQEPPFAATNISRLGTVIPGKGLLVSYSASIFDPSLVTKAASMDIHVPEKDIYINCGALASDAFGLHRYRDVAPGLGRKMAFLQRDEELTAGSNNPAFLVSIVDEDDDTVFCQYEWRLGLVLHTGQSHDMIAEAWRQLTEHDIASDPKRAIAKKSRKRWCVG